MHVKLRNTIENKYSNKHTNQNTSGYNRSELDITIYSRNARYARIPLVVAKIFFCSVCDHSGGRLYEVWEVYRVAQENLYTFITIH